MFKNFERDPRTVANGPFVFVFLAIVNWCSILFLFWVFLASGISDNIDYKRVRYFKIEYFDRLRVIISKFNSNIIKTAK